MNLTQTRPKPGLGPICICILSTLKTLELLYTEKKMLLNQKHFFPKACISWIQINMP